MQKGVTIDLIKRVHVPMLTKGVTVKTNRVHATVLHSYIYVRADYKIRITFPARLHFAK